jgi:hypothetical protein
VDTPPVHLRSLRDLIPFADELGIEVTQTQIYHYPSATH